MRLRANAADLGILRDDSGSAIIEFVYLAVLLMVPLVYLLLTVFRVQAAAYSVSGAAREAGRVFVSSDPSDDPGARAFAASSLALSDSGLTLRPDQLDISCSVDPCLTPGATVEVTIDYTVALPFMPRFLGERGPASVRVTSRHLEVVDRFRATR